MSWFYNSALFKKKLKMAVVFVISVCICRNLSTTFQIKQDRVLVVVIAGVKKKKV